MIPKDFQSPTTPGLMVTFENYLIELICLNMDNKLEPRFWRDEKYWKKKYGREVRGVFNLKCKFESVEDPILRLSIISIIKKMRIKSLCAHKTVDRV